MLPPDVKSEENDDQEVKLHDLLNQCATNLTAKAAADDLPRAHERSQEIEHILTSLASPLKGRIVITGEARVGKTVIIYEVANRLANGDCPDSLRGSELWGLSARSILRAFGVQGWQEHLGGLMEMWATRPDVILYVDALPTTRMAGATAEDPFDMAQFLLGQLQSSDNRILAEGRTQAVRGFFETYPEYKHVLMELKIPNPPLNVARTIVRQASQDLETSQGLSISAEAVESAIDLTRRFALHEELPGKAIDLLSEGLALQSEINGPVRGVSKQHIIERFGEKTGLPEILLTDDVPYDETAVRRTFSNQVLGQEQAVDAVVQALSLLRTRLNNPNRPMGVFLFMGPTGVGKTELARALAEFLFGSDDVIVRFNMADFTADWHVQTLFGNPHGYDLESQRGLFTTRLQDRAFSVVLLDEFEKAHPEVFQRFLQLFDEGLLINGASETVNLQNSIVILTSNFGSQMLTSGRLGFGPKISIEEHEQRILNEMDMFFSPELINRIDNVCFFKPLTKPVLREIAYRRVQEILQREGLLRRKVDVEVDANVIEWVVEHGYSERYGARYLARQIEKTITYPLAQQLIRNNPPDNSQLRLFVHNDRVASALVLPTVSHTGDKHGGEAAAPAPLASSRKMTPADIQAKLPDLRQRIEALESLSDANEVRARLSELLRAMSTPTFWDDTANLQANLTELEQLSFQVDLVDRLRSNLDEMAEYAEQAKGEGGRKAFDEALLRYRYLSRELPRTELTLLFSDDRETYCAYLHIEAVGQRPVAREWAAELSRMYSRWSEQQEMQTRTLSEEADKAGRIKDTWIHVEGYGAYGLLQGEQGTHRLVQAAADGKKRQIVRARVQVYPDLPEAELATYAPALNIDSQQIDENGLISRLEIGTEGTDFKLRLSSRLPVRGLSQEGLRLAKIMLAIHEQPGENGTADRTVRIYQRHPGQKVKDPETETTWDDLEAVLNGGIDPILKARLAGRKPA